MTVNDDDLHRDRRHDGAVLRVHRDRAVEEVVHALHRVEEGQAPEADQRQRVTPDRLAQQQRHEEVHQPPADRRDEQADQIVNEQPGDRRAGGAGDEELRQVVAHHVDEARPRESREEVPETDV